MSDASLRKDCYAAARQDRSDARDECGNVYDERQTLCGALGQAAYEPTFGPDFANNFVSPLDIGGARERSRVLRACRRRRKRIFERYA